MKADIGVCRPVLYNDNQIPLKKVSGLGILYQDATQGDYQDTYLFLRYDNLQNSIPKIGSK